MFSLVRQAFKMIGPGQRGRWWLLIALAVFVSVLEMAGALMVYVVLEMVVNPEGTIDLPVIGDVRRFATDMDHDRLLVVVIVGIGVFFVFRALVKVGAKYAQYRVAHNTGARISGRLVEGYLYSPYAIHLRRNSSELVRNAHQAVDELVGGILIPMIKVAAESILTLGLLAVLFAVTPFGTLLAVIIVGGAGALLLFIVQPRMKRIGRTAHESSRQTLKSLQQSLHGIRDLKMLGRERFFAREYTRNRVRYARARYLKATALTLPPVAMEAALIGLILLFLGLAVASGAESQGVLSVLGLFGYAALRLKPSLQQIISGLNEMKHATAPLDDLYADLEATAGLKKEVSPVEPLSFTTALRLENVGFRYEGADRPSLTDVNLVIRPGEQIGVCGPTGGGKTTLVDIITGLLEPTTGRITIDGRDLRESVRSWQQTLGVVHQMVFLIDDTLRRNIALGLPDRMIEEEALEEAVELAQLSEFVASLPQGLETTVGERGIRLSGGQRQRIAIARALYRRPSVLVFDEGTSALDNATEDSLMDAIERLRGDHTIILIAHRLSTVRRCDKIVFVENGRVAGVDSFDDLERLLAASARTSDWTGSALPGGP